MIDDFVAVHLGVDRRDVFQREARGLGEEAHQPEPDAVLLFKGVLVAGARGDHFGHVDIVEGRQQGCGFLRALQPLGDGLAQAGHLDALFAAVIGGRCGD